MAQHFRSEQPFSALARAACVCAIVLSALSASPAQLRAEDKPAAPKDSVAGEVIVVLAGDGEGGVDPSLGNIKALKQPPFNAFKSMKILSRTPVALQTTQASTVDLPNGRRLQLTLIERMPDGRTKVQVSINKPGQKDYLPLLQVIASAGEPFFVAGQKYQGGTLVIGVRVGETAAAK